MAHLSVPRSELTADEAREVRPLAALPDPPVPNGVLEVLQRLWSAGHAAYVVGGCLRDVLLARPAADWDIATNAHPPEIQALFGRTRYENAFGTVRVPVPDSDTGGGRDDVEVTTFRRDHQYGDHRRPDRVTFTDSLDEDLLRRDLTVNALAWGRPAGWVDPTGGVDDLHARVLRAVGDPDVRFDEDALRLLRTARLAAQLEFTIEARTLAAMRRQAPLVRWVAAERVGQELLKLLEAPRPSVGLAIMGETGVLEGALPDLAAQIGVPQGKPIGGDLWRHTLATVDAAVAIAPGHRRLALAALLHDVGKPETFADGRFAGHDEAGARRAERLLRRLAIGRELAEPVVRLIRHHMFGYESRMKDGGVRRFIAKVGPDLVEDLFLLRQADNLGSGHPAWTGGLDEFRERVRAQIDARHPLSVRDLAVRGDVLMRELGLDAGPQVGVLLRRLLIVVMRDPGRNEPEQLLALARGWIESGEPGRTGDAGSERMVEDDEDDES
jgi:tRNA nucleotidyltransferase (CCA-adding enzyme)